MPVCIREVSAAATGNQWLSDNAFPCEYIFIGGGKKRGWVAGGHIGQ